MTDLDDPTEADGPTVGERMAAEYEAGASIRELGKRYHHGYHQTRTLIVGRVDLRAPGWARLAPAPLDEEVCRAAVADYEAGASIADLAARHGCSPRRMRCVLAERTTVRPRGAAPAGPRPDVAAGPETLTDRQVRILQAAADGRTQYAIAGMLGVSAGTVAHDLAAAARALGAVGTTNTVATAFRAGVIR
jgi:DNA-binding NarL/FixJ family response regulator